MCVFVSSYFVFVLSVHVYVCVQLYFVYVRIFCVCMYVCIIGGAPSTGLPFVTVTPIM